MLQVKRLKSKNDCSKAKRQLLKAKTSQLEQVQKRRRWRRRPEMQRHDKTLGTTNLDIQSPFLSLMDRIYYSYKWRELDRTVNLKGREDMVTRKRPVSLPGRESQSQVQSPKPSRKRQIRIQKAEQKNAGKILPAKVGRFRTIRNQLRRKGQRGILIIFKFFPILSWGSRLTN